MDVRHGCSGPTPLCLLHNPPCNGRPQCGIANGDGQRSVPMQSRAGFEAASLSRSICARRSASGAATASTPPPDRRTMRSELSDISRGPRGAGLCRRPGLRRDETVHGEPALVLKAPRNPDRSEAALRQAGRVRADAPVSTPDRVAAAIIRGILMRRFTVGQRLIEAELTRTLQVSRGTVREALRILAANGVVELTPHRGAVIRVLSRADSQDLLEVMEMLAGLGARLAARKIADAGNRAPFEAIARKLAAPRSADRLASVLDERLDFYKVMFAIAANGELDRVLPLPRAHLFRTQFHPYLTQSDLRSMVGEYRGIAEAILAGDEKKAEARMRRHIQRTGERTLPRLSEFALD